MYLPFSSYCIEWMCLPPSLPVSLVTPIGLYYTCTVHTTTIVRDGELRSCRYWYMIYSCTIHIIIVKASGSGRCRQTSCVEGWNRKPGVHHGSCGSPLFVILEVCVSAISEWRRCSMHLQLLCLHRLAGCWVLRYLDSLSCIQVLVEGLAITLTVVQGRNRRGEKREREREQDC